MPDKKFQPATAADAEELLLLARQYDESVNSDIRRINQRYLDKVDDDLAALPKWYQVCRLFKWHASNVGPAADLIPWDLAAIALIVSVSYIFICICAVKGISALAIIGFVTLVVVAAGPRFLRRVADLDREREILLHRILLPRQRAALPSDAELISQFVRDNVMRRRLDDIASVAEKVFGQVNEISGLIGEAEAEPIRAAAETAIRRLRPAVNGVNAVLDGLRNLQEEMAKVLAGWDDLAPERRAVFSAGYLYSLDLAREINDLLDKYLKLDGVPRSAALGALRDHPRWMEMADEILRPIE